MKTHAFTLFEVLLSLVLLSIILLSISKIFKKNDSLETYYELQNIENIYIETKMIQNTEKIKFKNN